MAGRPPRRPLRGSVLLQAGPGAEWVPGVVGRVLRAQQPHVRGEALRGRGSRGAYVTLGRSAQTLLCTLPGDNGTSSSLTQGPGQAGSRGRVVVASERRLVRTGRCSSAKRVSPGSPEPPGVRRDPAGVRRAPLGVPRAPQGSQRPHRGPQSPPRGPQSPRWHEGPARAPSVAWPGRRDGVSGPCDRPACTKYTLGGECPGAVSSSARSPPGLLTRESSLSCGPASHPSWAPSKPPPFIPGGRCSRRISAQSRPAQQPPRETWKVQSWQLKRPL